MIAEEAKPCWTITCDGCGEEMGSDEYGCVHMDSREDAIEAVRGSDWREVDSGKLVCDGCVEGRVHEVACPACGAEVGADCNGQPSWKPCDERVEAFAKSIAASSDQQVARS